VRRCCWWRSDEQQRRLRASSDNPAAALHNILSCLLLRCRPTCASCRSSKRRPALHARW
jgi:hypothetical protein